MSPQARKGRSNTRSNGRRNGRPTLLTPELAQTIIDLVRAGVPGEVAAETAGVNVNTYYSWKRRGNRLQEVVDAGQGIDEHDELFLRFAKGVRAAFSRAEADSVIALRAAGERDWRAISWYLERSPGMRWRPNQQDDTDSQPKWQEVLANAISIDDSDVESSGRPVITPSTDYLQDANGQTSDDDDGDDDDDGEWEWVDPITGEVVDDPDDEPDDAEPGV